MIRVWAPRADSVVLRWSGQPPGEGAEEQSPRVEGVDPMAPEAHGWWSWRGDPTAYAVFDYAFVLDGSEPALPDPRSAWQPEGVHGPSRWFDPSVFQWGDRHWRGTRGGAGMLGGVVYEVHVGTFTPEGTLDAAIEHLDHLVDLGVDLVELMPLAAFPGRWGWGYDGVALYAVHDGYGGPAALQRFVDACHARGLGVCLDLVHNHLGPSGNHLSRFGPYFTDRHHTPWGEAINLDAPGSAEVRTFLIDQCVRWFRDFHIDSLRLDAVHELKDDSATHFLAEFSDTIGRLSEDLGRPLDLIAESDLNDVAAVAPTALGGWGMTAVWNDDAHHALHVALSGETHGYYADFGGGTAAWPEGDALAVLAKVFEEGYLHDGRPSTFRNQDWGVPVDVDRLDARRLVAYLQNHDQIGNRATGDRLGATVAPARLAIGAALLLMGPFTPMLFMGEEWGATTPFAFFTGFEEAGLADAVRTGRRAEFATHGWRAEQVPDPQDPATRHTSVLDWGEVTEGDHALLRDWYAALITLRRNVFGDSPTSLTRVSVTIAPGGAALSLRHQDLVVVACLEPGGEAWCAQEVAGREVLLRSPFESTCVVIRPAAERP